MASRESILTSPIGRSMPAEEGAAPNCRVLWIVSPEVPLNPTHGPAFLLNHEYVGGLSAVNARAVFRLYTRRIRALIPPNSHLRGGEPFLKQREIGSFKRSKSDGSMHRRRASNQPNIDCSDLRGSSRGVARLVAK